MKNSSLIDLNIKPVYESLSDDLINDFYNPVLSRTTQYLRVSAYFSAKALSMYSLGLQELYKNAGKYKLIINQEISEEDYIEMSKGLIIKDQIRDKLLLSLEENLDLKDELNLSNLAFYIACNLIEIKIAFTSSGIFHDKFGFFIDNLQNTVYFRGSNNETSMAIKSNYESFDVSCSWNATSFEKDKIRINFNKFEKIWNNNDPNLLVLDLDNIVRNSILKFNKGKIVSNVEEFIDNTVFITMDSNNRLISKIFLKNLDKLFGNSTFVFHIRTKASFVDKHIIVFNEDMNTREYMDLINYFKSISDVETIIDMKVYDFIKNMNFEIELRRLAGINIKNRNEKILSHFSEYKSSVDSYMVRELRERQMWDSFFMFSMKRSSNFSVPGSGKTSSVLGVYSYLRNKMDFKRIIVIGPKNAYYSWITEYDLCFGKGQCNPYNWNMQSNIQIEKRYENLLTETGNKNLIFFNYESLPNHIDKIKQIVNSKSLLVYDEIHKIKKYKGIIASASIELAKNSDYVITLTGTPIPNSYLDIYNNLVILFRADYNSYFGFHPNSLLQPTNQQVKDINNRIYPFFCRTSKSQLNVPETNKDKFSIIDANTSENLLFENLIKMYRNNKFALLIRIMQLESDASMIFDDLSNDDFDSIFEDIDDTPAISNKPMVNKTLLEIAQSIGVSSKMKATLDLVESLANEGKQVIIWCVFKKSILNLYQQLSNIGIKSDYIYGDVSESERNSKIERFKSNDYRVLITNPHTLAESVSLHKNCHDAIYYEFSYNLVHLLQSKDRIHRLGLTENQYTQYYFNQVNFKFEYKIESLGQRIYERLSEKEKTMIDAIDNNTLETTTTSKEDLDFIFSTILN